MQKNALQITAQLHQGMIQHARLFQDVMLLLVGQLNQLFLGEIIIVWQKAHQQKYHADNQKDCQQGLRQALQNVLCHRFIPFAA